MKIIIFFLLLGVLSVLANEPNREKVVFEYRALPGSLADHSFRKRSVVLRLQDNLIFGQVYSQGELILEFGGDAAFTRKIRRLLGDLVIPELDWKSHLLGVAKANQRRVNLPLSAHEYVVTLVSDSSVISFQMIEPAYYVQQLAKDDDVVRRLDAVFECIDAELGPDRLHFFRQR